MTGEHVRRGPPEGMSLLEWTRKREIMIRNWPEGHEKLTADKSETLLDHALLHGITVWVHDDGTQCRSPARADRPDGPWCAQLMARIWPADEERELHVSTAPDEPEDPVSDASLLMWVNEAKRLKSQLLATQDERDALRTSLADCREALGVRMRQAEDDARALSRAEISRLAAAQAAGRLQDRERRLRELHARQRRVISLVPCAVHGNWTVTGYVMPDLIFSAEQMQACGDCVIEIDDACGYCTRLHGGVTVPWPCQTISLLDGVIPPAGKKAASSHEQGDHEHCIPDGECPVALRSYHEALDDGMEA
jgi:hypothetical protein